MAEKSEDLKNRFKNVVNAFASVSSSGAGLTGDDRKRILQSYKQEIKSSFKGSLEQQFKLFEGILFKDIEKYKRINESEMENDTQDNINISKAFHRILLKAADEDIELRNKLELKKLNKYNEELYKSANSRKELTKTIFNKLKNEEFQRFILKYMRDLAFRANKPTEKNAEDIVFKKMSSSFSKQREFFKAYSNQFLYRGEFVKFVMLALDAAYNQIDIQLSLAGLKDIDDSGTTVPKIPGVGNNSNPILRPDGSLIPS